MVPPGIDPIMSGTYIWLFRHLEHQNLSINSDFMDRARGCNNSEGGGAGVEGGGGAAEGAHCY